MPIQENYFLVDPITDVMRFHAILALAVAIAVIAPAVPSEASPCRPHCDAIPPLAECETECLIVGALGQDAWRILEDLCIPHC